MMTDPLKIIIPLFMIACTALAETTITTNVLEPCHYFDTVRFDPNNAQHNNQTGEIVYNNIKYNTDQFGWYDYEYKNGVKQKVDRHLRGCLCTVHKGACIRLCNEYGEVIHDDEKVKHNETTFKLFYNVSVDAGYKVVDLANVMRYKQKLIHGTTCEDRTEDDPEMYELLENGSLYHKERKVLINHEFYCLAVLYDNDNPLKYIVSPFICDPDQEPLKCEESNTIQIENDYIRTPNNSIIHRNITYDKSHWGYTVYNGYQSLRVCLCDIIKTCIRLCCQFGEVIVENNCEPYNGTFNLNTEIQNSIDEFPINVNLAGDEFRKQLVFGRKCSGFYYVDDSEESVLQKNGTILSKESSELAWFEHHQYCLGAVEHENNILLKINYCEEGTTPEGIPHEEILSSVMLISLPFLIVTFLVYALIPELRNIHGKCLMFYVLGLTVSFSILPFVNFTAENSQGLCKLMGYTIYFSFMFSFFWVNVICFDIWLKFSEMRIGMEKTKKFAYYFVYACGSPILLVLLVAAMENIENEKYKPNIARERCFFSAAGYAELIYLYIPMGLIISANITFSIITMNKIRQTSKAFEENKNSRRHSADGHEDRDRFFLYLRLLIIMGVTWSAEVVSWVVFKFYHKSRDYFIVTDIINSLQGVLIFVLFVVKKRVWMLIQKRWNQVQGKRRSSMFDNHSTTRKTCVPVSVCDTSMEMQNANDKKKDISNT